MQDKIKKLEQDIADAEEALKDPVINADPEFVETLTADIAKYKAEIEELKKQVETAVDKANEEVHEAKNDLKEAKKDGDSSEVKSAKKQVEKAQENLQDIKEEEKKVEKASDKAEKLEEKVKIHGGRRGGSGRPKGAKNKPKEAKAAIQQEKIKIPPAKEEKATVWGQKVSWRTEAEFCEALRKAYLKRRKVYKTKGKKTKPAFSTITSKVGDALEMAAKIIPQSKIKKNPKEFLAKFMRLERSAQRFLEDFKSILGNEFKKGDISKEFGEVENTIKKLISKIQK